MYGGACLGMLVVAGVVVPLVFGRGLLNRHGRERAERAFGEAYPGYGLRLGELDYELGANRLVARSATVTATNFTLEVGRISITGVRWAGLLRGSSTLAQLGSNACLEASDLRATFPRALYEVRCARVRASVPESDLVAEDTRWGPLGDDEAFFAAHPFRSARYRGVLPRGRVSGLVYDDLLLGKAYQAGTVELTRPSLEVLVNHDKVPAPSTRSPRMVHEALAALQPTVRVGSFHLTNGSIAYQTRFAVGAQPASLTFGSVHLTILGIANRAEPNAAIEVRGQGDLMNAGTLSLRMSIPIAPPGFSLRYSGSLGPMDLTRLDPFLGIAEHVRIGSGTAREVTFEIEVTDGQALGWVRADYEKLRLVLLDSQDGTAKGFDNQVATFVANLVRVRHSNSPDRSGVRKEGQVRYARVAGDNFLEFVWHALWSGVRDVISP